MLFMGLLMGLLVGLLMGLLLWADFNSDAMAAIWWESLDSKHRSIFSMNFQAMAKGRGGGPDLDLP